MSTTTKPVAGIPAWSIPAHVLFTLTPLPNGQAVYAPRTILSLSGPQSPPMAPLPENHDDSLEPLALASLTPDELRLNILNLTELHAHVHNQLHLLHTSLAKRCRVSALLTTPSLRTWPSIIRFRALLAENYRVKKAEANMEVVAQSEKQMERAARVYYGVGKIRMAILTEAERVLGGIDLREVRAAIDGGDEESREKIREIVIAKEEHRTRGVEGQGEKADVALEAEERRRQLVKRQFVKRMRRL
ncbi:hypothetical protein BJ508DRAFT_333959 [Ascobolus immersus RN42]|uniref:Uncharacterized protein n=1 Tax=Ascobolus immersus RN42 TaxID=1160509 RepID=A0A3N4HHW0_ASCIM|nr:hypothetical protein BJ508DRAFT_333959 [Ascobolus immersus RN42]